MWIGMDSISNTDSDRRGCIVPVLGGRVVVYTFGCFTV